MVLNDLKVEELILIFLTQTGIQTSGQRRSQVVVEVIRWQRRKKGKRERVRESKEGRGKEEGRQEKKDMEGLTVMSNSFVCFFFNRKINTVPAISGLG